jgi:hypothetical protein
MQFATVVRCSKCHELIVSGRASCSSRFPARKATSSFIAGFGPETVGKAI